MAMGNRFSLPLRQPATEVGERQKPQMAAITK
jgi:hypothetical protein